MRPLRAIPDDFGQLRAANYAYRRRWRGKGSIVRETTLRGGACFALDLSEWPQAQAFLLGSYDRQTVDFIVDHLPPGGTFVDVGSHVGLISFQVLRRVPSSKVHAFDPHPRRRPAYKRNMELNNAGHRATFNPVGLSSAAGQASFDLTKNSIVPGEASVRVIALDEYAEAHGLAVIDALKLDVEGHELQALEGAEDLLGSGRIRSVTLEAMESHGDTDSPRELLEGHGYRRVAMPESGLARVRRQLGKPRKSPNAAYVAPGYRHPKS
jgi:FkbM family methyltransferase